MRRTKNLYFICFQLIFLSEFCHAQIDSTSIRIPQLVARQNNQNLISKAIDGAVYLVRQEYLLESPTGEKMGRGILNYFGKEYSIGVLVDGHLWMPSYVRRPWQNDANFTEHKEEYEPVCSYTKIKPINSGEDYRVFKIEKMDLKKCLTSFQPGLMGLAISDSLPQKLKLQLYYVDAMASPDESEIKSTTINLSSVEWDVQGMAEIDDVKFKDRHVLGGAVFIEKISLGRIDVELVALYTLDKENWILQSVSPIIQDSQSN